MKKRTIRFSSANNLLVGILLVFCIGWTPAQAVTIATPDGYAAYKGTTGGGNASPITVTSASAFKSAVSGDSQAVIVVSGRIDLGGAVTIGSNKTIIGANTSSGLYGGTIKIQGSNYIIQNLTFGPTSGDVLEISGATKVFITKCSFHDSSDELCSVVRQSDYVTISWSKFYFDNPDSHSFAHLIGNGDDVTADRGKLHVTLHHNWYAQGVRGRMPRVRFGHVHIYNNYYNCTGNGYCVGVGYECHIRIENSHFDNINSSWADYGGTSNGEIGWSGLKFEGCSQPTFVANSFPVYSPPYSFSLDPVNDVESAVKTGAGNVMSQIPTPTPITGVSVSPTSASLSVGATQQLAATVSPSNATNKNVSWASAKSSIATVSSTGLVTGVSEGSTTIMATTADGGFAATCNISVTAGTTSDGCDSPVAISIPFTQEGAGEYCWKSSGDISYISSWNLVKLEINGVDYTNTWLSELPAKQDGYYNFHYVGKETWSHLEIASMKSAKESIAEKATDHNISLYPNPVNEQLNIQFGKDITESVDIHLLDLEGKTIKIVKANGAGYTLDMSGMAKGAYIIRVNGENINAVERIVKH